MALLPSGSREDVELVVIETKDFSLIIKGKPYHHKYESFLQYQSMDFHDFMQFNVRGEGLEKVHVFDVNQKEVVDHSSHRPIFFENSVYQVIVSPKSGGNLTFYHEHVALRKAVSRVDIGDSYLLMGNLHFQNDIGLSTFEIRSENKTILEVTIEVFPTKLDYKQDYQALLEEVNDEVYNLAYHFLKKTYSGAKIKSEGTPSLTEFYQLIRVHFEDFMKALDRIEKQPHHKLTKTYEMKRGDQLKRIDSKGRNFLRKKPDLFKTVEKGIPISNEIMMPVKGLGVKKTLTYETIENRYVKWMTNRLSQKLEGLLEKLTTTIRGDVEIDTRLIDQITKMKHRLTLKRRNVFWREIGDLDRSVMSLVLQMAPGYREAYKLYLVISKGLSLQGKLYQMSVKDVATLYEYWTYLKLGQILSKKYEHVSQDIVKVNRDGLFVNLDANASAKRVFKHPITNERIELAYQKKGGKLPTVQQKPDIMLTLAKKGKDYSFNYIFDAKYRIDFAAENTFYGKKYQSAGPLEEDINTMHRYRDSIVVKQNGPYERNAFGAYVLFPWGDELNYQQHHFYKSIDEVNIGGLPFLPNAKDLVEQFVENLIDKSPEEILNEGILPRGTKEDWISSLEEKVLVGVVSTTEQYRLCIQDRSFSITSKHLHKGWQEAGYVALYNSKETGLENGVVKYGKISSVDAVEDKVIFVVEGWKDLSPVIKPVNYGIATYVITTLNTLKEAKELPELFMKSKEEMMIWRMLRRVSNQIKIKLDTTNIDKATKVHSFKIKEIEVRIYYDSNHIEFIKNNSTQEINLETLLKQPSKVYKQMVKMLQIE